MSEVRALLLTDVVDSTRLSEQLGDAAMAALWAAHDKVARALLPTHRGREIDKTDGFLLLFETADDAVAYALAYHRALRSLDPPLQARAGLHVGPVILTENAPDVVARGAKPLEVDGIAKPTAARVMSVAVGGQTLLTEEARRALGRTSLRVESHGHWRMKGLAEPIELFEVGDDAAPFVPPPDGAKVYRVVEDGDLWLPVKQVKHSLPAERDAFVGRSEDLQLLARRLDTSRLVSVLGIGGTGKTRLVTRFGWSWLGDYPGGVWFCDLSEARSVDGIVAAVARALDIQLSPADAVVQLGHAIAGRGSCLVILDNFEQVARHADQTLGRWLDRAAEARFVVTTREILGLGGEAALPLAPLVPDESVQLFVRRARQASPGFVADDEASIRALVELLDRLPLAIELAAARVRLMPPKALLQRMSQRFKLLASGGGRHTRQATLRGTLDWSWDLLAPDEQAALAQLSVFEGGFTLDAAEGVLTLDALWPMDAVQALVDKSLVRQVSDERFDLLVSVQEYAAEKLEAQGERLGAEARHAAWYAQYGAPEAIDALYRHGGAAAGQALQRELDNVVVACRRSVASGDAASAVALFLAAWEVFKFRGPVAAGSEIGETVARMPDLSPEQRAASSRALSEALQLEGRMDEARAHSNAALAVYRQVGDRRGEGAVLNNLGNQAKDLGRADEARACLDLALAVYREADDRLGQGKVLNNLGVLGWSQGRMHEAHEDLKRALALDREVGNRRFEGIVLGNLGGLCVDLGRTEEARQYQDASLAVHREVGNRNGQGLVLGNLGYRHLCLGALAEAQDALVAALALAREVGNRRDEGIQLGNLGLLHAALGRLDEARVHFEAALAVHREVGNRHFQGYVAGHLGTLDLAQGRLDEAEARYLDALAASRAVGDSRYEGFWLARMGDVHLARGRMSRATACVHDGERLLRDVREVILLAQCLCIRARLEHARGDLPAARATLDEAGALAARAGVGGDSELGQMLAAARLLVEGASTATGA